MSAIPQCIDPFKWEIRNAGKWAFTPGTGNRTKYSVAKVKGGAYHAARHYTVRGHLGDKPANDTIGYFPTEGEAMAACWEHENSTTWDFLPPRIRAMIEDKGPAPFVPEPLTVLELQADRDSHPLSYLNVPIRDVMATQIGQAVAAVSRYEGLDHRGLLLVGELRARGFGVFKIPGVRS